MTMLTKADIVSVVSTHEYVWRYPRCPIPIAQMTMLVLCFEADTAGVNPRICAGKEQLHSALSAVMGACRHKSTRVTVQRQAYLDFVAGSSYWRKIAERALREERDRLWKEEHAHAQR